MQSDRKTKAISLISINFLVDRAGYIAITLSIFNYGINIAIFDKNYITTEERDRIKERNIKQ